MIARLTDPSLLLEFTLCGFEVGLQVGGTRHLSHRLPSGQIWQSEQPTTVPLYFGHKPLVLVVFGLLQSGHPEPSGQSWHPAHWTVALLNLGQNIIFKGAVVGIIVGDDDNDGKCEGEVVGLREGAACSDKKVKERSNRRCLMSLIRIFCCRKIVVMINVGTILGE